MADKHHPNRTLLDIEILNVHPVLQAVVDKRLRTTPDFSVGWRSSWHGSVLQTQRFGAWKAPVNTLKY